MLKTVANGNGFAPPLNTLSRSDPNLQKEKLVQEAARPMILDQPVKDEEAQFDLVEEKRAMSMVGRDPNPP